MHAPWCGDDVQTRAMPSGGASEHRAVEPAALLNKIQYRRRDIEVQLERRATELDIEIEHTDSGGGGSRTLSFLMGRGTRERAAPLCCERSGADAAAALEQT